MRLKVELKTSELRGALFEITAKDVTEHSALIADLRMSIPHQIDIVQETTPGNLMSEEYNCFEYAFDLFLSVAYKEGQDWQQGWKINPVGVMQNSRDTYWTTMS